MHLGSEVFIVCLETGSYSRSFREIVRCWLSQFNLESAMFPQRSRMVCVFGVCLALIASSEAFFLKWGSDSTSQASVPKVWQSPGGSPVSYRYQYMYPYDSRKFYQLHSQQYAQPDLMQSMAPIPISVPAGASLTPVSLQHVQLVPCMCPVAPEEAEKLQEQVGPGPYMAQTYQQNYPAPQQMTVADTPKTTIKQ